MPIYHASHFLPNRRVQLDRLWTKPSPQSHCACRCTVHLVYYCQIVARQDADAFSRHWLAASGLGREQHFDISLIAAAMARIGGCCPPCRIFHRPRSVCASRRSAAPEISPSKSAVRTQVTKARHAIAVGAEEPETAEAIRAAISELDRAVTKGVLHRNNAGRRKSRLMARLHKAQEA